MMLLMRFFVLVGLLSCAADASAQSTPPTPAKIFEAIAVQSGLTVCEIGAGDGELSIAAARLVGTSGHVYASELGAERVKKLQAAVGRSGLTQITVVDGHTDTTQFPDAGCDALFMHDVYHHLSSPARMNPSILAAMKAGGRVAVVDFTPPGQEAPAPADRARDGMHGVYPETIVHEMKTAGFELVSTERRDRWFMVVVSKPKVL